MHKQVAQRSVVMALAAILTICSGGAAAEEFVLVEDGVAKAPIVIIENAPPYTRMAAEELALYIEKTSGARPQIIEGEFGPIPQRAVWVGYQPVMDDLFSDADFDFEHPEEILVTATENHLAIAGRDVWNPDHLGVGNLEGVQQEYGTHNAVYTFLHRYLDVRWLWPGELGEDIVEQKTIAFEPFAYRYHPQVLARGGLLAYSTLHRGGPSGPDEPATYGGGMRSNYWLRAQRLQLSSFGSPGGHGFGGWWDRFHEEHPEYFAMQPDGTRSPYPSTGNVKMCLSNPGVAEQWLDDVAAELEENPNERIFNASPNDGWWSGHCICENCRAWDNHEAEPRRMSWNGISQNYVALSDRHVTFANRVARGLKGRFPDKELYVYMLAYGHSRPAPVEVVPDDNVIIGNVANFLLRSEMEDRGSQIGKTHREQFGDWGKVAKNHFWRPNVGSPVGWQLGLPDVPFQRTIDDMKFAADNGWMGIYVDYIREHWSTQAPMYYLMAQLTWDPSQDGQAILDEFYDRAYGPASEQMKDYWAYMEQIREQCYSLSHSAGVSMDVAYDFYNEERLSKAASLLEQAKTKAAGGPEKYQRRIRFTEVGLEFTRLFTENGRLMQRIRAEEDETGEARQRVKDNWEQIRELQREHNGAMLWRKIFIGYRADGPPSLLYPE